MIIGLMGYPGSGKDTIAKHLVEKHGFVRVAFADAMREDLLNLNPIIEYTYGMDSMPYRLADIVDDIGWDDAKRVYPEVRRLLQVYGTEVGRGGFGDDCWLRRASRKIEDAYNDHKSVVVTDLRFDNEHAMLKEWGYAMGGSRFWHVVRPGHGPINSHASEQLDYAKYADATIANDSTLENLCILTSVLLDSACKLTNR